jgi:hypothetical protein
MTESVLIQPVESPVICKPCYEPTQYWESLLQNPRRDGRDGARPSKKRPELPHGGTASVPSAGVLQEARESSWQRRGC